MTRTPTLIAAELGAMLADQPAALELLRELLSTDVLGRVHGTSEDSSSDAVLEARRRADRARQKTKRDQRNTAKQTMGSTSSDVRGTSMDASSDKPELSCDLSSEGSSNTGLSRKAGSKKGTRLSKDSVLRAEDHSFAVGLGIPDLEVARVWAEFVDYWIGVPGARGCKLDWDATWRNRVRALTPWKGTKNGAGHNGRSTQGAAGDFFAGLAAVAADIGGDDPVAGPADPDIPRGRVEIEH